LGIEQAEQACDVWREDKCVLQLGSMNGLESQVQVLEKKKNPMPDGSQGVRGH
jgi:hypothetical protein